MKIYYCIALLLGCGLFTGCKTDFVSPANPSDYGLLKIKQKNANNELPKLEQEYYATNTSDARRLQIRGEIVFRLLDLTDEYYRKWESDFYGRSAFLKTAGETSATTLAAAATATAGATAKILSGLSAGIGAGDTSFSKNFLQEQAISLLTARADALRDKVRAGILTSMQQTDLNKYSLGAALADVQAYARAGSLVAAAAAIQSDNGTAKATADAKLDAANSR